MADLADGAVAVIGGHVDQDGGAARAVAFEHDFLDLPAFQFAGAAHDGLLDVVGGHADGFGGEDRRCAGGDWRPDRRRCGRRSMISLMMRVKLFPRLASRAAFLCLMVAHLEWPDM